EIAEASRIDAELSHATFEPIDLAQLLENLVRAREDRGRNAGRRIASVRDGPGALVHGLPLRPERVLDDLLDNPVSFAPARGTIEVSLRTVEGRVQASVCD